MSLDNFFRIIETDAVRVRFPSGYAKSPDGRVWKITSLINGHAEGILKAPGDPGDGIRKWMDADRLTPADQIVAEGSGAPAPPAVL